MRQMPHINQIQGTQKHYLPCVVTGLLAPSLGVKWRLKGAPDLCPLGGQRVNRGLSTEPPGAR